MNNLSVKLTKKECIIGTCYLFFQLLILPVIIEEIAWQLPFSFSAIQLNFIFFSINFIATTIIFRRLLFACGRITLKNIKKTVIAAAVGFGLYWMGSILMSILAVSLDPNFQNVNDASISQMAQMNFPLVLISTVLLAPTAEELLYRGLVFGGLSKKNRLLAYTFSALFFALLHIVGYIGYYSAGRLLLCTIQYLPAGYAIAYVYEKADSIWAPILLHTTNNLLAILLL